MRCTNLARLFASNTPTSSLHVPLLSPPHHFPTMVRLRKAIQDLELQWFCGQRIVTVTVAGARVSSYSGEPIESVQFIYDGLFSRIFRLFASIALKSGRRSGHIAKCQTLVTVNLNRIKTVIDIFRNFRKAIRIVQFYQNIRRFRSKFVIRAPNIKLLMSQINFILLLIRLRGSNTNRGII